MIIFKFDLVSFHHKYLHTVHDIEGVMRTKQKVICAKKMIFYADLYLILLFFKLTD
jgi:hypothetical protein